MRDLLLKLWGFFGADKRKAFVSLLLLMVIASFAEVISLGVVLPFLGMLVAPEQVYDYFVIRLLADYLQVDSAKDLQLPLTVIFSCAALFAGGMRLFLMKKTLSFSVMVGADISSSIYERTLFQPYEVHSSRNSSEIINSITTKVNTIVSNVVLPTLAIISSIIMLTFVSMALLAINPLIAFVCIFGFGFMYVVITLVTRLKIERNSVKIARESSKVVKFLQEGIGGIRDILIDGNQSMYCRMYRESDYPLKKAQGENQFIAGSPRFAMEAMSMVFIAVFAYFLINHSNADANVIAILGTFAIGAQRMLPALQQTYACFTNIKGSKQSFRDVMEFLDQPIPIYSTQDVDKPVSFNRKIVLHKMFFNYKSNNAAVLKNINLELNKGDKIGFVGSSGGGKSTLLDIIMGLLVPTKGQLLVDDCLINPSNSQSWQKHIAHVPQAIFLSDDTIKSNIAFGVPKELVDVDRVKKVAKEARLDGLIESWPDKYETFVGERGSRLSGGQRQRIGIARALYKQASLIILDEATSSLDTATEDEIMDTIEKLDESITVLIIAHRLSTLKNCKKIIEIDNGHVVNLHGSLSEYNRVNYEKI